MRRGNGGGRFVLATGDSWQALGEFGYEIAVSRDDGESWDFDGAAAIYSPERRILGRGWPRTVSIDDHRLGTVFFDLTPEQEGAASVFFIRTELVALE